MDLFSFDYTSTHDRENNEESQTTLVLLRKNFEGQNKKLFDLLMSGKRLTFSDAYIIHGISDIRRRSKDLAENGIRFNKAFVGDTRNKVWWMDEDQIKFNRSIAKPTC